jgi:PAS domain S-box-containing protein
MDICSGRLFEENYQESSLTVTGNMSVVDVISQMNAAQTSYALVLYRQQLVGIFTERDAVRAIANRTFFENINVAEAMSQPMITISKADAEDISIVIEKFHQYNIGHLPVMDDGKLIGIITQIDILRMLYSMGINSAKTLQQTTNAKRAELKHEIMQEEGWQFASVSSHEAIRDWNLSTNQTFWSQRWFEMLGYEPYELSNSIDEWHKRIHPDDYKRVITAQNAYLQHQISNYSVEYRLRRKDGSYGWFQSRAKAVWNEQGNPIRLVGFLTDITERKQTELEIIKSRDLLEAVYNESADAIFLVDTETLITTDCNQRAVELFEASSKDEIINIEGQTLQKQQFTVDDLTAIVAEINQQRVWSRELQYITKKNNEFWGNIAVKQITVAGQRMNLVRVTDISERKRTEQMLELQAVITRNMAEGICLVRATDGIIVYANPKFETMFGYDSGELTGQHVSIVNYEDENMTAEEVNQAIRAAVLQDGEATYEVQNVKKDGTPFWCRATTSVFEHPEYGKVLVAVQQDITQHKQSEEKVQRSLKEKEVLLKEIHHRVKNNLGIVSSLLQMQSRRSQEPQVTSILLDSQNRIDSIAMVHEKLYRSEDLANVNFAQYIPDLIAYLFESYNTSSNLVKLYLQVDDVGLDIESAIPCGLIVNELVSNALKYAFPNNQAGKILVKLYQKEYNVILIVQDNGVGLPVDFDKKKTKTLGINLIQGLVKQLRGNLEINSQQGTEFKITFKQGKALL